MIQMGIMEEGYHISEKHFLIIFEEIKAVEHLNGQAFSKINLNLLWSIFRKCKDDF